MIKNIFVTIIAFITVLLYSNFTASADESSAVSDGKAATSAGITSQNSSSTDETQSDNSNNNLNDILRTELSENNSAVDYYNDDYYDTDGNATLVNNQKIIYNSDEMQFISVTTKDGNVFYVLINYNDEDNIDNVYFLNKVDDYDLYALLYAGDENSENITPEEATASANASSDSATSSDNSDDNEQSQAEETTTKSSNQGMMKNLMILGGAVAIGAVVFFVMLKSKKKNKSSSSNADMYDFDDSDDIEINEDEE